MEIVKTRIVRVVKGAKFTDAGQREWPLTFHFVAPVDLAAYHDGRWETTRFAIHNWMSDQTGDYWMIGAADEFGLSSDRDILLFKLAWG